MRDQKADIREGLLELLPALRRFCAALTGSRPDADDLLQSTVERLLSSSMPEGADLKRWAFRVARNLFIDEHRKRIVRSADPYEDTHPGRDGEASAANALTLGKVREAIAALPAEQRMVVGLVAVEGFSYKEAAETLEIPIGTVMSRLARARKTLTDSFGREPVL